MTVRVRRHELPKGRLIDLKSSWTDVSFGTVREIDGTTRFKSPPPISGTCQQVVVMVPTLRQQQARESSGWCMTLFRKNPAQHIHDSSCNSR
jgi:hypothetical protein